MSYRDTFKEVGALRAAAFALCERLRGTANEDFAIELHDSVCSMLKCDAAVTAEEVRVATKLLPVAQAITDIIAERARQLSDEGWTVEHDDSYSQGELALAAACYAEFAGRRQDAEAHGQSYSIKAHPPLWPWMPMWWKPTNPRRDLVKAGALIAAEIERLDRFAKATDPDRAGRAVLRYNKHD